VIFFIRFITATCLFSFLGKANVWLTPLSNIILAIGYRFFLILSPIFDRLGKKYAVGLALIFSAIGSLLFFSSHEYLLILGALLVGIGLSVSGYLIKAEASETPSGAAFNKIALNAGSLLSGLILLLAITSKSFFFTIGAGVLFLTAIIALIFGHKKKKAVHLPVPKQFNLRRYIAWLLVGIAVGIKLFGVFSVLPQYLIDEKGYLPNWYGLMIFLNSGIVILLQLPLIHFIERFKANNHAFKLVLIVMCLGMLLIAFPQVFHVQHIMGATLWTLLLSVIECFASYLDVQGSRDGFLLIKETSVGLGAGLTVLLSRELTFPFSAMSVGLVGIAVILIAAILLYKDFRDASKTVIA
jgi:MFS family permease